MIGWLRDRNRGTYATESHTEEEEDGCMAMPCSPHYLACLVGRYHRSGSQPEDIILNYMPAREAHRTT